MYYAVRIVIRYDTIEEFNVDFKVLQGRGTWESSQFKCKVTDKHFSRLCQDILTHYDTVPECDERTYRQTNGRSCHQYRAVHSLACGSVIINLN